MLGQAAACFIQDDARHRLQQDHIRCLQLIGAYDENAIALVEGAFNAQATDLALNGVVQIEGVTRILIVEDDQVDGGVAAAPIGEGLQRLGQQRRIASVHPHQQDGIITGNSKSPQTGLPAHILGQDMRRGPQHPAGVQQRG